MNVSVIIRGCAEEQPPSTIATATAAAACRMPVRVSMALACLVDGADGDSSGGSGSNLVES
jgi:hypothetical protein